MCNHCVSCHSCSGYLTAMELIPAEVEHIVIPGLEGCNFCKPELGILTPELVANIGKKNCIKCEFDEMMKPVVEPVSESSMVLEVPEVRVQNAERFLRCTDCSRGYMCSPNCGCPPECGHNTHKRRPSVDFTGYSHETGVDGQSSKRFLNMDDSDMN